jgi:hypothetical protein
LADVIGGGGKERKEEEGKKRGREGKKSAPILGARNASSEQGEAAAVLTRR